MSAATPDTRSDAQPEAQPDARHRVDALHHVQIGLPPGEDAVARAEAFYSGLLGLARVEKPARLAAQGGAWFRGDGVELHLGVEDPFEPVTVAHPGLMVDGLQALRDTLEAAGVTALHGAPERGGPFSVRDPFGNRLEFLERANLES